MADSRCVNMCACTSLMIVRDIANFKGICNFLPAHYECSELCAKSFIWMFCTAKFFFANPAATAARPWRVTRLCSEMTGHSDWIQASSHTCRHVWSGFIRRHPKTAAHIEQCIFSLPINPTVFSDAVIRGTLMSHVPTGPVSNRSSSLQITMLCSVTRQMTNDTLRKNHFQFQIQVSTFRWAQRFCQLYQSDACNVT